MLKLSALLMALLMASVSNAKMGTGNDALINCESVIRILNVGDKADASDLTDLGRAYECTGFIEGVVGMNSLHRVIADKPDGFFCLPDDVSISQLARVLVKYLRSNPERLHESSIQLMWEATLSKFPCLK